MEAKERCLGFVKFKVSGFSDLTSLAVSRMRYRYLTGSGGSFEIGRAPDGKYYYVTKFNCDAIDGLCLRKRLTGQVSNEVLAQLNSTCNSINK